MEPDAFISGETGQDNCNSLTGVTIELYQDWILKESTVSDGNGEYLWPVPNFGYYDVVASKVGYRDETQSISITQDQTYTLDFVGEHGLIPDAPSMSYVLGCINHWLYPVSPCGLSMSKVLAVINAWLYPT